MCRFKPQVASMRSQNGLLILNTKNLQNYRAGQVSRKIHLGSKCKKKKNLSTEAKIVDLCAPEESRWGASLKLDLERYV